MVHLAQVTLYIMVAKTPTNPPLKLFLTIFSLSYKKYSPLINKLPSFIRGCLGFKEKKWGSAFFPRNSATHWLFLILPFRAIYLVV